MVIELPIDNSVRNLNLAELSTTTTTVSFPLSSPPPLVWGRCCRCLSEKSLTRMAIATCGDGGAGKLPWGQGKPKERNNEKRQCERLRDKGEVEAIKLTRICKLWKTFSWNTLTWGSIVRLLYMKLDLGKYKYSNGNSIKVRNYNWLLNL